MIDDVSILQYAPGKFNSRDRLAESAWIGVLYHSFET